jgi:predicted flap endonuclease-1-like 5' DNA nuclease
MTWKRAFLILGAALLVWLRPWRRLQSLNAPTAPTGGATSPYPEVLPVPAMAAASTELPAVTPEEAFGIPPDDALDTFELPDEAEPVAPFGADLDAALDLADDRIPALALGPDTAGPNQEDVLATADGALPALDDDLDLDELEAALDEDATAVASDNEAIALDEDDELAAPGEAIGDAAAYEQLQASIADEERADEPAAGEREAAVMGDAAAYEQLQEKISADEGERQSTMAADAAAEERLDAVMADDSDAEQDAVAVGEPQAQPDDLLLIDGIGPRVSTIVAAAGITSFAQLAAADVEQLRSMLVDAGIKTVDPSSWPEQARIARAQGADALREHQRRLREERAG